MQTHPSSSPIEVVQRSTFWSSRPGATIRKIGLAAAWVVLWLVTFIVSLELAELHYVSTAGQEGFAAMLGIFGVPLFGPGGFLVSYWIARKKKGAWLFLIGAPISAFATVALFVFAFCSPFDRDRGEAKAAAYRRAHDPREIALESLFRSAPRAPIEGRRPEDRLLFVVAAGETKGLIDVEGRIVVEPQFAWASCTSEGRAMVGSQELKGFVDGTGRAVIEPAWGNVSDFRQGLAAVATAVLRPERTFWGDMGFGDHTQEESKRGYIDRDGKVVIAPRFAEARSFSEGVAWVSPEVPFGPDAKWGLIDKTGRFLIEPRYSEEPASFSEGLCPVWLSAGSVTDDKVEGFGYIDTRGTTVIPPRFREAGPFKDGLAPVVTAGKLGFIDRAGKLAIPPQYDRVRNPGVRTEWPTFSEGIAPVKIGTQYGFIDKTGRTAIEPRFESAACFSDGLAAVTVAGLTGFIDRQGHMVITPQFRRVDPFESGIARVEVTPGEWGYVRRDGTFVWNPVVASPK
jgi:hypothetical protein